MRKIIKIVFYLLKQLLLWFIIGMPISLIEINFQENNKHSNILDIIDKNTNILFFIYSIISIYFGINKLKQ